MKESALRVEVYTFKWCPYCRRVKALLDSKGISYQEVYLDDDKAKKDEMAKRTGGDKSVPQVFVNGKYLGDYDKLEELEAYGKLNEILGLPKITFNYDKVWELVIIGAGPAALSAAVYAARKGLDFCLISGDLGGQVIETDVVDNYTGFPDTTGPQLIQSFWKHVSKYNINKLFGHRVINIELLNGVKIVQTDKGRKIQGLSVVIAAGTHKRKLGIPGEKRLSGNGVSYCAICDGPLFEGQPVAIIGGGNSGLESSLDMVKLKSKVSLIEIGEELKGDRVLIDKVKTSSDIDIYTSHKAAEIKGKNKVEALIIEDTQTGNMKALEVEGIFIQIGLIPNTDFVKDLVEINERKEIVVGENNQTNVEGIFAAGDITNVKYKQIMIAAAEGVKAALMASEYIGSIK